MVEVQEIFREFGEEYREKYNLPINQLRVMSGIENCRSAAMGGHIDECDECGHIRISYNSCRNRHCPKCQSLVKEKWLEERRKELLPVQYFHVVFTIPDSLNKIALRNAKVVYSILFKAASDTLLELSEDHKHLGAQIGFTSIIHTWGQNLMYHPHIHCIVTGGGLDFLNRYWVHSKKDFFIPVRVLSKKFRGKFLAYLKHAYYANELNFVGEIKDLDQNNAFLNLLYKLKKNWVVYCKKPFKNAKQVLNYLGRYTHRVAIANHRIIKKEGRNITFNWKDYKDGNKTKTMIIDGVEFIRRFMLHILPYRFVKIRHYGILSNRNRKKKIQTCRKYLMVNNQHRSIELNKLTTRELIIKLTGIDIEKCPCCSKGKMVEKSKIHIEKTGFI